MVTYKLYPDKSSIKKYYSRYLQGGKTEQRGRKLAWWERYDFSMRDQYASEITIDSVTEVRPDILAYQYYGTSQLEWVILQYNNIVDVQEQFIAGRTIMMPSMRYIMEKVITKNGRIK